MFSCEKNGYSKNEVDTYIQSLTSETELLRNRLLIIESDFKKLKERENEIKKNGETISIALTAAIEKAKAIELSSKNVFQLKIQQLSLLYKRWEKLLNEILEKHPEIESVSNISFMLNDFKKAIENVIKQNFEIIVTSSKEDATKQLINKMSSFKNNSKKEKNIQIKRGNLNFDLLTGQSELKRMEEKSMVKPITNLKLEKEDKFDTLAEKFLTKESEENSVYENLFTKQFTTFDNGFDLQEAISPKSSLEEIMKAFDFFNSSQENA